MADKNWYTILIFSRIWFFNGMWPYSDFRRLHSNFYSFQHIFIGPRNRVMSRTRSLRNRGEAAATPPTGGLTGAVAEATPSRGRGVRRWRLKGTGNEEGVSACERRTCDSDTSSTHFRRVNHFKLVVYWLGSVFCWQCINSLFLKYSSMFQ